MRLFFIACQFLTIIPLPVPPGWQGGDMGRSMRYFPLVGLAIGGLLAGVDYCLAHIFPLPLVSLLLVAVLAMVTGALHLDGLADVCDGFGARGGRDRFLSVMKDSSTGAIGVVGVVLGLMLKTLAITHLPGPVRVAALVFFPCAARFAQVLLTTGSQRARGDGLGATFITDAGRWELATAGVITIVAGWFLLGSSGIFCCIIIALLVWLARSYFKRRLGGITGDIIGAVSEVAEIICLLTIVATPGA